VTLFLIALTSGLGIGSIYALVALGYSFIFRTTGTFNFAQGQLATIGSLLAYSVYMSRGWPVLVALAIAIAGVGILGGVIERVAVLPLIRRNEESVSWLISTLGVAVLLTGAAERIWGTQPLLVSNYVGPANVFIGHIGIATPYIIAFAFALLITVGVEILQRVSIWGRIMKAMGENRVAVELAGVNVYRVGLVAFVVGSALAGLAGFIIAPVTYADSTSGFGLVMLAFVALALGGFANHWGALIGGLIVGVVESVSGAYVGLNNQDIVVLAVLLLVLLVRPQGLFGNRSARAV
jgi:branched-chain amino acid transport system permease protein